MAAIIEKLKEHFTTVLVTTFLALLTFFSDVIVEKVKLGINRANLRTTHYESMASSISSYVYASENVTEFYANGWTDKSSLHAIVPDFNTAIVALRKNEYVYFGLLNRYWDKEDINRFRSVMETVKKIDFHIHLMNGEAQAVETGKKERADMAVTKPITDKLLVLIKELDKKVTEFLSNLV
jgi:hypothetical protein